MQLIPLDNSFRYSDMAFRNLNKTWRDVVFEQYEEDHAAGVPFPVTYLINATQWKGIYLSRSPPRSMYLFSVKPSFTPSAQDGFWTTRHTKTT
jgi:hypothetical protein